VLLSKLVKGQMSPGGCCETMFVLMSASSNEMDVFLRDGGVQQLSMILRPSQTGSYRCMGSFCLLLATCRQQSMTMVASACAAALACATLCWPVCRCMSVFSLLAGQ
jgi:hypothetical protein